MLDHDVDARVGGDLRRAAHECWTVAEAGLAQASDDDISVYCDERRLVLITHDVGLVRRRREMPYGLLVHLRCRETEARRVLREHLDEVVHRIGRRQSAILRVSLDAVTELPPVTPRRGRRRRSQ